ncbi:SRPBCC family protein [Cellulomonas endophytica]|uniref:SRPBCC family protein n=1 Tax=Cellulomonas endophytica TaxID=2494735 RepID=UPI0010119B91|nr:SRPBCC domain-containing protein [Cellulomonas endophytica]
MTITSVQQDPEAATLTVVTQLAASPEEAWRLWADPRRLERWWGPPTWPATFETHDLAPGGSATYSMTGPEGERARGWWRFTEVDAPHLLAFEDGFADDEGRPADGPVTRMRAVLEAADGGTRMTLTSTFASPQDMQGLVAMGMVEGLQEALSQIDGLLVAA